MSKQIRIKFFTNFYFIDNSIIIESDRLGKIFLTKKYQEKIFTSGKNIIEIIIPWRERFVFKQYVLNEGHKYSIKLFEFF